MNKRPVPGKAKPEAQKKVAERHPDKFTWEEGDVTITPPPKSEKAKENGAPKGK